MWPVQLQLHNILIIYVILIYIHLSSPVHLSFYIVRLDSVRVREEGKGKEGKRKEAPPCI